MFDRLRTLIGRKMPSTKSTMDLISHFDLSKRPITRGILLKMAHETDVSVKWFQEASLRIKPRNEPITLEEHIDGAVICLAMDITTNAMEKQLGQSVFMPQGSLPKESGIIVAFGFVAIVGMINPLRIEGYEFNFQQMCLRLVASLFMMHSLDEQGKIYEQAGVIFRKIMIAAPEMPNVRAWLDNSTKLIFIYLEKIAAEISDEKQIEFSNLFAAHLRSLIECLD